ncbi:hypothetical protein GCM10010357_56860 [Streptomyces luteireticuli]|uniref:Uncharacterized protein n=1 Tax=Streptomyces luteireticuli TaxID=173858 RepID=A0ABN0Z1D0_9ACTN
MRSRPLGVTGTKQAQNTRVTPAEKIHQAHKGMEGGCMLFSFALWGPRKRAPQRIVYLSELTSPTTR